MKTIIIDKLKEVLMPFDGVYAMWLEGADAIGQADEYSDIDIYVDMEDDKEEAVIQIVEETLSAIRPLDYKYVLNHPHPKLRQRIYHLEGTSEYLMIDFCFQLHSRNPEECVYLEGNTLEAAKVVFDKKNIIQHKTYTPSDYYKDHLEELKECDYRYSQHSRVLKYVKRGKYLEAFAYYHKYVVDPLIKLLRMKHTPANTYFYLIHISDHIPASDKDRLENLVKVSTLDEIEKNIPLAVSWYDSLKIEMMDTFNNL